MAVKEVPKADVGKIAGAVAAVIALAWTGIQVGHYFLRDHETLAVVVTREDKADEIHEATNKVLSRLTTQATLKEEHKKAKQAQCRKLIARGIVEAKDCDPGEDATAESPPGPSP